MYKIGDMQHQEMVKLITNRLDRLAMCKRGVVETDINDQLSKLGNKPYLTGAEKEIISDSLASRMVKAMTPTVAMFKKFKGNWRHVLNVLQDKALKLEKGAYVHPQAAKWEADSALIRKQRDERIATIDGDFQDVKDEFILGVKDISEFSKELLKLEQGVW